MEVVVTGLSRSIITMYADGCTAVGIDDTHEYTIDFIILSNNSVMDSSLSVRYDGDLTFEEAKRIVEEKLTS